MGEEAQEMQAEKNGQASRIPEQMADCLHIFNIRQEIQNCIS